MFASLRICTRCFCKRSLYSFSSTPTDNVKIVPPSVECRRYVKQKKSLFPPSSPPAALTLPSRSLSVESPVESKDDKSWKSDKLLTVPNVLSVSRIVMSPFVAYHVMQGNLSTALVLFGVAGLTDFLDGQIARRVPGQRSVAGTILDPVGDKLLMGLTTASCTAAGLLPWWLGVIIIGRDVILLSGGLVARWHSLHQKSMKEFFNLANSTIEVKPGWHGKLNMCTQLGAVLACMAAPLYELSEEMVMALDVSLVATGCFSVYSLVMYMKSYKQAITKLTSTPEWMLEKRKRY